MLAAARTVLSGGAKGVTFNLTPPNVRTRDESIPAGPMLPGWQLSASIVDPKFMD